MKSKTLLWILNEKKTTKITIIKNPKKIKKAMYEFSEKMFNS